MPRLAWFLVRALGQLRFKFLQAFVLDKEMSDIEAEAFYEELPACKWLLNGASLALIRQA